MSKIEYTVRLFSYWHCGSGLAAGAESDALVVKDADGLPFIPGKTVKGLVREALDDLYGATADFDTDLGKRADVLQDDEVCGNAGQAFFRNAEFDRATRSLIVYNDNKMSNALFTEISSTAIDNNGVAKRNSLRRIQVALPCTLVGEISNISSDDVASKIADALRMIKQLGQGRYHGLGRCEFTVLKH